MKNDRLADSPPIRKALGNHWAVPYHFRHSSRCRARFREWPAFTLRASDTLAPLDWLKLALMKPWFSGALAGQRPEFLGSKAVRLAHKMVSSLR
jgi:hypothetical protein